MKKRFSKKVKVILKIILIIIFLILAAVSFFSAGTVWKFFESTVIQQISIVGLFFLSIGFIAAAVVTFEDLKY